MTDVTEEKIIASPLPGEMEGNEPEPVEADVDQLPYPDVNEEIE